MSRSCDRGGASRVTSLHTKPLSGSGDRTYAQASGREDDIYDAFGQAVDGGYGEGIVVPAHGWAQW